MPFELGTMIQRCRKKSGLSQQQLAKIAGVGKTVVYDIEKGKLSIQLDTLQKILRVLNIHMEFKPPISLHSEESTQ